MPTQTALISTVPNGAVPLISTLTGIDVSTVPDGSAVMVLGNVAVGDGGADIFYFSASSTAGVNTRDVFATNTTGRWLRANSFSGVAQVPPAGTSYSGRQETFTVLSGTAPGFTMDYIFPPSVTMIGKGPLTIKSITTGLVTLYPTGVDQLFDTAIQTSISSSLITGKTWSFQAVNGRWYRTDEKSAI